MLDRLPPDKLEIAERRLRHPAPGSRIEAARNAGIDLTLLVEKLRLKPAERVRQMQETCDLAARIRGAARRNRS